MRRLLLVAALCLMFGPKPVQAQERSIEELGKAPYCERTIHRYNSWEELPDKPGLGYLVRVEWKMPKGLVECLAVYHFRNALLKSGSANEVICLPMDRITVFCGSTTRFPAKLVLLGTEGSARSYDTETEWMFYRTNLYFPIVVESQDETGTESDTADDEQ